MLLDHCRYCQVRSVSALTEAAAAAAAWPAVAAGNTPGGRHQQRCQQQHRRRHQQPPPHRLAALVLSGAPASHPAMDYPAATAAAAAAVATYPVGRRQWGLQLLQQTRQPSAKAGRQSAPPACSMPAVLWPGGGAELQHQQPGAAACSGQERLHASAGERRMDEIPGAEESLHQSGQHPQQCQQRLEGHHRAVVGAAVAAAAAPQQQPPHQLDAAATVLETVQIWLMLQRGQRGMVSVKRGRRQSRAHSASAAAPAHAQRSRCACCSCSQSCTAELESWGGAGGR